MSGERREGARFLTELPTVLLAAKGGEVLDDRATAHDISPKGFKVEMACDLPAGTMIVFHLELGQGEIAKGKGKVVWSNREQFATWAGVEILSMGWADKRKLNALLNPDQVDWGRLGDLCLKAVIALTVVSAAHRLIYSPMARGVLSRMTPKIIALLVMGWALINLLKREKRR